MQRDSKQLEGVQKLQIAIATSHQPNLVTSPLSCAARYPFCHPRSSTQQHGPDQEQSVQLQGL